MRFLIRFLVMAFLLAPLGQIGAQNPCDVCTPKDTTLVALNAFKAKMGNTDKSQDARIASLEATRARMQKDINILANKLIDLNARPVADPSVENELVRQKAELARQRTELARIENELSSLNRQLAEARAKAREQVNEDTKQKTTGMSNGTKWAIAGGATTVVVIAIIGGHNHWWGGGSTVSSNSSSYSCSGACR